MAVDFSTTINIAVQEIHNLRPFQVVNASLFFFFDSVIGRLQFEGSANLPVSTLPTDAANGLKAGLVVLHERDSAIVRIGFRATKKPAELLSMPLYYTEVRFQGVVDDNGGAK